MSQSDASKDVFKLNSQDGAQLCRKIARPQLGFDPHSYSLDVATTVMDGINALVTSKCGSGKTGILALLAICIARFGEENSLLPANCRKDFSKKLEKYKIRTMVINSVQIELSQHEDRNLWTDAIEGPTEILLAPEQLEGDGFSKLVDNEKFRDRIYALMVDEVHLASTWSVFFRKAYGRIGRTGARLPSRTRLLLLTATLRKGSHYDNIINMGRPSQKEVREDRSSGAK
ncbi:hypothetical protein BT96DRAFT_944577 [Gymnopus androsaceus JB14]|uniref:Helicase ATP-binding domain-containing protein n=1 Tax=Gymnopus androsaceus JB14 TaxID=1447944 RepID=A0A6A4H5R2_9AGAR|nr:hypothetical protein BT96DRAFT_944577 [Gymnopus androsaceus JB14]